MGKILNYKILGTALKSLSDACFIKQTSNREMVRSSPLAE